MQNRKCFCFLNPAGMFNTVSDGLPRARFSLLNTTTPPLLYCSSIDIRADAIGPTFFFLKKSSTCTLQAARHIFFTTSREALPKGSQGCPSSACTPSLATTEYQSSNSRWRSVLCILVPSTLHLPLTTYTRLIPLIKPDTYMYSIH